MGIAKRFAQWLGTSRDRPVVGITFGGSHIVATVLRGHPVRLVGIGRSLIDDGSVIDGDIRLPDRVARRLGELREELRLPIGTDCVIAVAPLHESIQVGGAVDSEPGSAWPDVEGPEWEIAVDHRVFDQAGIVARDAGFRPIRIDVRPAALARVAVLELGGEAAVKTADGWSVAIGSGGLDASRRRPAAVRSLQIGPYLGALSPVAALSSVSAKPQLGAEFHPDLDAEAYGAALSAFVAPPHVVAAPIDHHPSTNPAIDDAIDFRTVSMRPRPDDRPTRPSVFIREQPSCPTN